MEKREQEGTGAAGGHDELRAEFFCPPDEYRPVPFWWWGGEPLERDRLLWQLETLKKKGIINAVVSYSHRPDGITEPGEPPVFSAAWWELFRWFVGECKKRGMKISFQDYTLLNPLLQLIGRETPGMEGGQLKEVSRAVEGGGLCVLTAGDGCRVIAASAYPVENGTVLTEGRIALSGEVRNGRLDWRAPAGSWLASLVYCVANPFDPMHPLAGRKVIERFYTPFEANCPGELGRTLPILFQDELDFGARMPLWSERLLEEFRNRKGYGIEPLLPALWHDFGPVTAKVRIDYSDVVTTLLEENYFIPVFRWAESRGVLLANDNAGRGLIEEGRKSYGDFFRTMRWYGAPGNDDPRLDGPRAFKGLKVNSSIAHLYKRPRVWNEVFHSSGWGATPAQVIAALNEDFAYGATVVNLHGLYYTTCGSWWEWAPPDFHFRQPYWAHMRSFNDYAARLSYLLSRGVHVCDVAMVYPVTSIEAGLSRRLVGSPDGGIPYSEAQSGNGGLSLDEAEAHAFGLGRALFDAGIDFDFVDFQSLERAELRDNRLCVAGEEYRVLLLPAMSAARFSTLHVARAFQKKGGVVIAYGCLPSASDKAGSHDPDLDALVGELFSPAQAKPGLFVQEGYGNVKQAIDAAIARDFIPRDGPLCVLHRRVGEREIYYVFNRGKTPYDGDVAFRAAGPAYQWDAWTGSVSAMPDGHRDSHGTLLRISLEPSESIVIVFAAEAEAAEACATRRFSSVVPAYEFDGEWECELQPTLDNRYGDFRLPAHDGMLGAEARQFRYAEEKSPSPPWHLPEFDDTGWPLKTCSFGPRFLALGPLPPGSDLVALEKQLVSMAGVNPSAPVMLEGQAYGWKPYEMSLRWGIENDPFLKDWASGPHGLKKEVPPEFLDFNCDAPGSTWYVWSTVPASETCRVQMVMGSRSVYSAWLNGLRVMSQDEALPPGRQSRWNLPHYRSSPQEATVELKRGDNPLLLKFSQPCGQRVRAYAAFDPPPENSELALRWFSACGKPVFNCYPGCGKKAGWYRFVSPPGLTAFSVVIRGRPQAWVDGKEVSLNELAERADGAVGYRVDIPDPVGGQVTVALRVELQAGSFAGDAFPEPVLLECGKGRLRLGDWSRFGLGTYSGIVRYTRRFSVAEGASGNGAWLLDLGEVAGTAEVRVNGRPAGTLVAPPWRLEVTELIVDGENSVEVVVANTLANHYSVGIPTPYVHEGQTVSGLLGPVRLVHGKPHEDVQHECRQ